MAADEADLQPLFTLSRVAANRQQFEAAVTATAQSDPAANISQGDLICFDEGGATHEALPPLDCPLEGARHITPSPLSERAESMEPQRHTGSTHSAPVPDLTGQSESPQVLKDALRLIEALTGVVKATGDGGTVAKRREAQHAKPERGRPPSAIAATIQGISPEIVGNPQAESTRFQETSGATGVLFVLKGTTPCRRNPCVVGSVAEPLEFDAATLRLPTSSRQVTAPQPRLRH
ncbi:hypothetical protein HPB52_001339 [Rhipicephalus sanguineus]|uniref:Uncharacterized protein n=1 Tax=Rhipicephalus sanguineus TaxID=34632 RepID=A0A9D4T572_RHISA|nr:hypothetical protein HPB52_001339 [Rhipicephalus sanguineus]